WLWRRWVCRRCRMSSRRRLRRAAGWRRAGWCGAWSPQWRIRIGGRDRTGIRRHGGHEQGKAPPGRGTWRGLRAVGVAPSVWHGLRMTVLARPAAPAAQSLGRTDAAVQVLAAVVAAAAVLAASGGGAAEVGEAAVDLLLAAVLPAVGLDGVPAVRLFAVPRDAGKRVLHGRLLLLGRVRGVGSRVGRPSSATADPDLGPRDLRPLIRPREPHCDLHVYPRATACVSHASAGTIRHVPVSSQRSTSGRSARAASRTCFSSSPVACSSSRRVALPYFVNAARTFS